MQNKEDITVTPTSFRNIAALRHFQASLFFFFHIDDN